MKCEDTRALMDAYVDGELDLAASLEIEGHLQGCAACMRSYRGQQAMRDALAGTPLYYRTPPDIRKRIQSVVRQESRATEPPRRPLWAMFAAPVLLLLVAVLAWGLTRSQGVAAQNELIAQEVLSGSMRSLIAGPLTDVQSSDRHTVKPWFAGKLDFSPSVQDFAPQGFPLAGGRLDYIDNRPVAALVYRHQQHVINLYTWPSGQEADRPVQKATYQGYNVFHWDQRGMTYWAVSDMDASEVSRFVQLFLSDSAPPPTP